MLARYFSEGTYNEQPLIKEFLLVGDKRRFFGGKISSCSMPPGFVKYLENFETRMFFCFFSSPLWRKLNIQLKCRPWRWRHNWNLMVPRWNVMTDSSDAANSRFRILNWFFKILLETLRKTPTFRLIKIALFCIFSLSGDRESVAENHCRYRLIHNL